MAEAVCVDGLLGSSWCSLQLITGGNMPSGLIHVIVHLLLAVLAVLVVLGGVLAVLGGVLDSGGVKDARLGVVLGWVEGEAPFSL